MVSFRLALCSWTSYCCFVHPTLFCSVRPMKTYIHRLLWCLLIFMCRYSCMFGWVYEYSNGANKRMHQYGQLKKRSMVMLSFTKQWWFKGFICYFIVIIQLSFFGPLHILLDRQWLRFFHAIFYWAGNDWDISFVAVSLH